MYGGWLDACTWPALFISRRRQSANGHRRDEPSPRKIPLLPISRGVRPYARGFRESSEPFESGTRDEAQSELAGADNRSGVSGLKPAEERLGPSQLAGASRSAPKARYDHQQCCGPLRAEQVHEYEVAMTEPKMAPTVFAA